MENLSQKEKDTLIRQLKIDEGCKLQVYPDKFGYPTIGYGRCLSTKGLTKTECDYLNLGTYEKNSVIAKLEVRGIIQDEAEYLLLSDIDDFSEELHKRITWFKTLPETAKIVLINMSFNLGVAGLLLFKKTLALIEQGNYKSASIEMLDSTWAKQVGDRAKRLSKRLSEC